MTDARLAKLATQILKMFQGFEANEDILKRLQTIAKKQKLYFENFSVHEFLKFYFFILSLKQTGNFDLAVQIMDKLFFATLFAKSGSTSEEECDSCSGEGRFDCDTCDGSGWERCENCDGTGMVDCSECESGKMSNGESCDFCDGTGEVECDECDSGSGQVDCHDCDGQARLECNNCEGEGTFIGEDDSLDIYLICSWDKDLKNLCELNAGEPISVGDVRKVLDNPKVVVLNEYNWNSVTNVYLDEVESDKLYCTEEVDESKLLLSPLFEFRTYGFGHEPKNLHNFIQ